MKTTLKKIIGLSAAWFLLCTAAVWAQSSPTVSLRPSSLDFGTAEFDTGKSLSVLVKNTSQQPIKVGALIASNSFNVNVPGTQNTNPGEEKTVNVFCVPRTETTVTGTVIITAGFAGQTLKKVAEVPVKCTGLNPFFRFNLKPTNVGFSEVVNITVTGDPVISQLACAPTNDKDPFFGCDLRLRKNVTIRVESSSPKFQGFSNGTGPAAACNGTAPCAFRLTANAELTAKFAPPPAPKPTPPPTQFEVSLKKLGPGSGRVVITTQGGPTITTDGLQNGLFAKATFPTGARIALSVTPDAKSTVRSIIVSGNDPNASACNGKAQCQFTLSGRVFVEVGFNKK